MTISDIFILEQSGVPYLARCYGGDSCRANPEHGLLSGFFAALNSFSTELDQNRLISVEFDSLKLLFSQADNKLVVVGLEDKTKEQEAEQIINQILDKMHENPYAEIFEKRPFELLENNEFVQWLDSVVEKEAMGDLSSKLLNKRKSIWQKIKEKLI